MSDKVRLNAGVAYLAALLALMLPLVSTPVLPLVDFYNHLARYFVLSHLDTDPLLRSNYAAAWALLPNLGLDAIATPLLDLLPPLLAAKVIAGFILLVQFSGVILLNRVLHQRFAVLPALLLVGLLYSFILNWGFSNFLLGLGLVFWNLALWFHLRERLFLATILCSIGALLIFFCHGFAFAIYGLVLGAMELNRWWDQGRKDVKSLGMNLQALLAQAIIPVILFLQMSTSGASGAKGSTLNSIREHSVNGSLARRLDFEFWYRLRTIFRVAESPYPSLDYITFTMLAVIIALALWKGWFRLHRWSYAAIGLLAMLVIVTPPSLFGVGYVSDRLPLVFALMLIAALGVVEPLPAGGRAAMVVIGVIAAVRIMAMAYGWSEYAQRFRDFREVTSVIPHGALVTDVLPYGQDQRDGLLPRCQMYRPLLVPLNHNIVALFANPTQQPLRQQGALKAAREDQRQPQDMWTHIAPGQFDDKLAEIVAGRHFRYVIMCGRGRLTRPLPGGVTVAAEKGGISVLKIR